jgi:hypothetical protein
MHDHDHDLIMALAEGTLASHEAAAAEAALTGCAECVADLDLQRRAVAALREAGPAHLNEFESARIRRNLRRELGIEAAAAPRRRRRFAPAVVLGSAAAVLLAVVLVGPALQNLSGGEDADTVEFAAPATTTTAAPDTARSEAPLAPAADDGAGIAEEFAGRVEADGPAEAPTTTAAAATEAPAEDFTAVAVIPGADDLADVLEAFIAARGDEESSLQSLALSYASQTLDRDAFAACGELSIDAVEGAYALVGLGIADIGEVQAIVVGYVVEPIEDSVVIAHHPDTCEILTSVP